jgi:putative hydrolase of the HAD superfamily
MTERRTVFFDAGNTIIRAQPSVGDVYAQHARDLGVDVSPDRFNQILAHEWTTYQKEQLADRTIPSSTSDDNDVEMWRRIASRVYADIEAMHHIGFADWFLRVYTAFGTGEVWSPYDDTVETLQQLRDRGYQLGIISNWSSRLVHILQENDLSKFFDVIVISSVCGTRKPDGAIFEEALHQAGTTGEQCIHVGDTYIDDIVGSKPFGIHGVLIDRKDRHDVPCTKIRSLFEVLDLL